MSEPYARSSARRPSLLCYSSVACRILHAGRLEAIAAQPARVAHAAGTAVIVSLIARHGERIIDAELRAAPDDIGLAERDDRRVQHERVTFDRRFCGQIRQRLKGTHE